MLVIYTSILYYSKSIKFPTESIMELFYIYKWNSLPDAFYLFTIVFIISYDECLKIIDEKLLNKSLRFYIFFKILVSNLLAVIIVFLQNECVINCLL